MSKITISTSQLYALMILFLTGSTIVVGLSFSALQDSFIAVLLEILFGIALFYYYLFILKKSSWKEFVPLLQLGFGSFIAKGIALLYSFYFLYIAGRVVMDFSFFITQVLHQESPTWMVTLPFLFVIGYSLSVGIEAIARSAEIMLFFLILILVSLWFLGFFSDEFAPKYLLPIFSHDWNLVFSTIFPTGLTFPYGEMIVFLVLLPYVKHVEKVKKHVWAPILLPGLMIIITMELVIGILHAPFANLYYFPFVKAMEMVNYLNIIEHLEIFTTLILLGGGFVKISVFLFAAQVALSQVFKIRSKRIWHVPFLIAVMFGLSLFQSTNVVEHLYTGLKLVPYYLHIPFQFAIPLLLGLIVVWKTHRNGLER